MRIRSGWGAIRTDGFGSALAGGWWNWPDGNA